jgi:release factor glutamine methyltransferase
LTAATNRPTQVGEVLLKATGYLRSKGRESPRLGAELLLANVLECDRLGVYLRFEEALAEEQLARYRDLVRRRSMGEPVAYLIGEKEFHSLKFRVSPAVLIPRPETETLVEVAAREIRSRAVQHPRVLDLGTGSGNVLIALAKEVADGAYIGVDASPGALEVARENVEALCPDLEITLLQGDWWEALASTGGKFDAIVSNPPYVASGDLNDLPPEISVYEPRLALDGGRDGLDAYREIARNSGGYLSDGGFIALEIGAGQSKPVLAIFGEHGFRGEAQPDLGGCNRVILLEKRG